MFDKSGSICATIKTSLMVIQNHNGLARIDIALGDFDSAQANIEIAKQRAMETEAYPLQLDVVTVMAELAEAQGNFQRAVALASFVISQRRAEYSTRLIAERLLDELPPLFARGKNLCNLTLDDIYDDDIMLCDEQPDELEMECCP